MRQPGLTVAACWRRGTSGSTWRSAASRSFGGDPPTRMVRQVHPACPGQDAHLRSGAEARLRSALRPSRQARHGQRGGCHPVADAQPGRGLGPGSGGAAIPVRFVVKYKRPQTGAVPDGGGVPPSRAGAGRAGGRGPDAGARGGGVAPADADRVPVRRDPDLAVGERAPEAGELRLRDSKTGPRVVPLSPARQRAVLAGLRARGRQPAGSLPGADGPAGTCHRSPTSLVPRGCGCPRRAGGRAASTISAIPSRRAPLALGESLPTIGKLLGHSKIQTTARYAHLARDSVKTSAARVAASIGADILPLPAGVSHRL